MKTKEISKLLLNLNSPDRFKLLEDGFIRDKFTGLEWAPSSEETMNLEDAIKYCEKIGCRLPEVQELYSLVNTIKDPCFFPIFKDTKKEDWYWSGTKTFWNKSAFWCVSFSSGHVSSNDEYGSNYVRPVRSSQT